MLLIKFKKKKSFLLFVANQGGAIYMCKQKIWDMGILKVGRLQEGENSQDPDTAQIVFCGFCKSEWPKIPWNSRKVPPEWRELNEILEE